MTTILRKQHPSLNDIHQLMKERILIPQRAKIIDGLVYKCAEVAESIMMDAVLRTQKKIVTIETVKAEPKMEIVFNGDGCGRYMCRECGFPNIYSTYSFCPRCGTGIKWIVK